MVQKLIEGVVTKQLKVIPDERASYSTRGTVNEFFLGDHNPQLIQIAPNVWYGFKNIGEVESLIVNVTTKPYDYAHPDEYRLDPHQNHIPYQWARKDG